MENWDVGIWVGNGELRNGKFGCGNMGGEQGIEEWGIGNLE